MTVSDTPDTPDILDTKMQVSLPYIGLYDAPRNDAGLDTQCLFGEGFIVTGEDGDFYYGTLLTDGYQGYVPKSGLVPFMAVPTHRMPTHRVIVPRSLVTRTANIKSGTQFGLSLGAQVTVCDGDESSDVHNVQIHTPHGVGYMPRRHLVPCDHKVTDWVAIAESLLGTPYSWGGRDSGGLDCSALIQLALQTAGIAAPRDSGPQAATLGDLLADNAPLKRGDLLFWKGHVGIMQDTVNLLHANAHHMQVASENLREALPRITCEAGNVTARRRILPI
ncbi:C40 family peptidase [Candidatus Puniceispirillum sp.]|uniref:C40 family peptidase n=1 Tax=Candidatus Puniceispirillum sp. TaxID=2026719 RepID=UPI003F698FEB